MGKFLLFLALFISKIAFSQVSDNFSDGDFTQNPVWQGDVTGYFINTSKQLQTVNTGTAQTVNLYTNNSLGVNVKWDFFVDMLFDPTSGNQMRIYLISDQANFNGSLNGYFLQIGEIGIADSYDLYRQSGTTITKIIDGPAKNRIDPNECKARIQVTRDANSLWELKTDITGGTTYTSEGTVSDNTFTSTTYFGVKSVSTKTLTGMHFYDDFSITELVPDVTSPVLTSANTTDGTAIVLNFNEAVNSTDAAIISHYNITPGNTQPTSVTVSGSVVTLNIATQLVTGNYTATVNKIKDVKGNTSVTPQSKTFFYRKPYTAKLNDIVINEIFPDPSPQVDLPSVEFIELYNISTEDIGLAGFKYSDPSSTATFVNDSIKANSYLILCAKADTAEFKKYGKVIGLSPWPTLNNSSDQIKLLNQNGDLISQVDYDDTWYRDAIKKNGGWTLERIDPFSTCQGATIWKASIDASGGTPGKQNSVNISKYDALALKVESFSKQSDSTLLVVFSKPLDQSSLVTSNFNLQPSSILKSITSDISQQKIILTYQKFQPSTTYQLQLGNLTDCSGKALTGTKNFFFKTLALRTDTAKLMISEIFADPSPEVGLPLIEFVEIYNAGKDTVDLKDYSISNGTTKGKFGARKILPNEYVIVCAAADTLSYQSFGKVIAPSSFPSLTNATGKIILKSHTDRLIDSIAYADTWYKNASKKPGGWSLEKIMLKENFCNGFYNWAASENNAGGTPGKINSVNNTFNTSIDLKIQQITLLNDTTVEVFLNFYPDTTKISQAVFSSQQLGSPKQVTFNKSNYKSFKLYYSQSFIEAITNTIQGSKIYSCNGLEMNHSQSFSKPFVTPINYPVVINEILPDPSPSIGLPESEFFELKNLSDSTVSLVNMIYEYGIRKIIFNKGSIQPKGFLIVCAEKDTLSFQAYGKTLGLTSFPTLSNDKGTMILKDNKGTEFHRVSYESNWYKDAVKKNGGWSLELIDPLSACQPSQNYSASIEVSGGTPGKQNSIYLSNKTIIPLQFVAASLKDSLTVLLTFNRGLDSLQATLASHYSINNGVGVPQIVSPIGPNFLTVEIKYSQFINRNKSYTLTVDGLTDCGSNILSTQTQTFIYPAIAVKNDVLINEILFNPRSGGVDFVEVYNNSDKILDFKNLKIAAVNDKDSVIQIKNMSSSQLIFQPQTLWVLTTNPDTVKSQYFTAHPTNFIKVASMPSYNDDSGKAVVLNKDNTRIDQLNYDAKMHFALLKDVEGISLERSSFTLATNAMGNFRSATASVGYATPADKNSQFLENVAAKNEISLASQTFSPDNDGFEDVLRILFDLPQANYVANVTIYNDQGKLIKKLVQNQTLASQGEWIWDGIDQDNNKAKTGIYIIYTELFDSNGNVKKYKKTAVSAAKFE